MITCTVSNKKITEQKSKCYGFLLEDGFTLSADMKACEKKIDVDLTEYLKKSTFTGKLMETCVLPVLVKNELYHLIFVGLGKKDKKALAVENYRRAVAQLYKQIASRKAHACAVSVPPASLFKITEEFLAQQTVIAFTMASYSFDDYITDKESKTNGVKEVVWCVTDDAKAFERGLKDGECIAHAVNTARHWIDLPPQDMTPPALASKAKAIAKKTGLKITVFDEADVIKMGMGGLAGVSRGSDVDCQMVILEYKTTKKNAPTLAFVGKGITFDSGGLSLKPANNMENMKDDMSGAAAVITTMEALAHLKPDVNVIGVAPISENLPSGKATKPGDILRFYNGKTAEVKNTDAEGRLVLADALSYVAKHYKPDAIIDIATLTGACAYALGPFFTGLMSQHDELAQKVEESAERTGDRVWRLPLHDDYKAAIKSDVADICNIGNPKYMAGAITAAHFLKNFVENYPWVHLDIAGSAYGVPDMPYYKNGATGAGVRLLIDLAMHWK